MLDSVRRMERSWFFQKTVWKRNLFLFLAVLLDLTVLGLVAALHVSPHPDPRGSEVLGYHVHLAFDNWRSYLWFAVIVVTQMVLAYRGLVQSFQGPGMVGLFPEDRSQGRKFGGLGAADLVGQVKKSAEELGVGPIRRILVSDDPTPNAYTTWIPGTGNVVVLHANVLEIMPPEAVRAVVAHEVGHVRQRDSLVYLAAGLPRSFLTLMGAVILWKIGVGVFTFDTFDQLFARVLFLALFWTSAMWVLTKLGRLSNLASQQSEYLADAYGAVLCGWTSMLNALLLLGQRVEAIQVLHTTLGRLPHLRPSGVGESDLVGVLKRLPAGEMDDSKAERLAPRLYIEARLAQLRDDLCVPFTDEQITELAGTADRELRRKQAAEEPDAETKAKLEEEQKLDEELRRLLIDWRRFDKDRSGHLDEKEAARLVAELRNDPKRLLFRQFGEPDAEWQSHPTHARRVLFLFDNFSERQ